METRYDPSLLMNLTSELVACDASLISWVLLSIMGM